MRAVRSTARVTPRRAARCGRLSLFMLLLVLAAATYLPARAYAVAQGLDGPGGIGVRLLDAPASAGDDPRALLYIVDHLAPATTISRRIEVTNTTDSPAAIAVYAAGASIDGGSFLGYAGDTPNELSTWNSVDPATLHLEAGGRASVTVTIAVPRDAAPGERYAAVWAEVRSGDASGSGIEQVNRVGIREYLSVGPGGAPAADFAVESLTAQRSADGSPAVLATVRNTGGRALDLSGELELLNGPGGLRAGPFPARLGSTLGIGDTGQLTVALDERLPDGPWDAQITVRSGLLERTAQATITFPRSGSAPPVPATSGTPWQWALLIAAGVFVVLLGALLWRAKARRAQISPGTGAAAAPEAARVL